MDGLETLRALRAIAPRVAVVMLSGTGDTQAIVESVRLGAADFLRKPCEPEELDAALDKALQRGVAETEHARIGFTDGGIAPPPLFAGQSRKMRRVESMIDHVADTDITVLIRGESGTGKELVARTICARARAAPAARSSR